MTVAICFNCGNEKLKVLGTCAQCSAIPRTYGERSQSLVLSDMLSSQEQLSQFASEIKNGRNFSAPESLYIKCLSVNKIYFPHNFCYAGSHNEPLSRRQYGKNQVVGSIRFVLGKS